MGNGGARSLLKAACALQQMSRRSPITWYLDLLHRLHLYLTRVLTASRDVTVTRCQA